VQRAWIRPRQRRRSKEAISRGTRQEFFDHTRSTKSLTTSGQFLNASFIVSLSAQGRWWRRQNKFFLLQIADLSGKCPETLKTGGHRSFRGFCVDRDDKIRTCDLVTPSAASIQASQSRFFSEGKLVSARWEIPGFELLPGPEPTETVSFFFVR